MNRKNLTAAVLAGLAGAAGLAGTAQAVNLNPDGLGQVLIYPYYTANGGNQTLLSVVNTTDNAKAVKVRFNEGFNSREVLDFNLYLSHHDVWVAAIVHSDTNPSDAYSPNGYETDTYLFITDDSCTVPYLYEDYQVFNEVTQSNMGVQPFLDYAYTGVNNDGGPDVEQRAAEGYFAMIEMGTITPGSDTEADITHTTHADGTWAPGDCEQLVENWTEGGDAANGIWYEESLSDGGQAYTDTLRNSGGLFGGAAVVHPSNGAMWSYDAKAIQGFDSTDDGIHFVPGTVYPSLNSGNETTAWLFFGVPQNKAVSLQYPFGVDAVSATFMHEYTMNEYTTADVPSLAATEWVVTFPTKKFYTDRDFFEEEVEFAWVPYEGVNVNDQKWEDCNYWEPGDDYPTTTPGTDKPIESPGPFDNTGWDKCEYVERPFDVIPGDARPPFTELYNGGACEEVSLVVYDRDERTYQEKTPGTPPVVSPAPPADDPDDVVFELCNEVNVLRFNEREVFSTPDLEGDSLLVSVLNPAGFDDGWAWINYYYDTDHVDYVGLVGLPVTGFAAEKFDNNFVMNQDGDFVKAFYGGLYWHKGNVRRIND